MPGGVSNAGGLKLNATYWEPETKKTGGSQHVLSGMDSCVSGHEPSPGLNEAT